MPHLPSSRRQTAFSTATSASTSNVPNLAASVAEPDLDVGPVARRQQDDASTPTGSGEDDTLQRLEELVSSMQSRLAAARIRPDRDTVREEELTSAYGLFAQIAGQSRALCEALLADCDRIGERRESRVGSGRDKGRGATGSSVEEGLATARGSDSVAGLRHRAHARMLTSGDVRVNTTDGRHRVDVDGDGRPRHAAGVAAVRNWRACLEELAAAHKLCLIDTYKRHEQFATPEILDALFADRKSRAQVVNGWMKNFGAYKRMQGQSGLWMRWESQFQNHEHIVRELAEINCLLQCLDSGITPNRVVKEVTIAPRGDTVLEFANRTMEWKPVLRFRVSSHMLAETSPVFAAMFFKHAKQEPGKYSLPGRNGQEEDDLLPPPPTPFVWKGGARTLLYRMPQLEFDKESAFTVLLHAAHMHNDHVPREVSFEQFVALAEVSLRYRCTSPLELSVEHRWLPQWVHKATDAMPDGLVVISYAFGLRRLFTRVTKTAILNLVDERELATKNWPKGIKERIWAVRCAKMAQVYQTCAKALEEYLQPPMSALPSTGGRSSPDATEGLTISTTTPVGSPSRTASRYTSSLPPLPNIFAQPPTTTPTLLFPTRPRCPKGSHWCDATNLGWLLLLYNSLHILPSFLYPSTLLPLSPSQLQRQQHHPPSPPAARSLAQIVDSLRAVASPPPHPDHRFSSTVCDPAPAFRTAINDVYNSVSGLTLYEIDGARHGWALGARHAEEPQVVYQVGHDGRGGDGGGGGRGGLADGGPGYKKKRDGTVDELTAAMGVMGLDGEGGLVTVAMAKLGLSEGVEQEEDDKVDAPAQLALKDEGICLRILAGMDSFANLHSAARICRNTYAVYKRNEPELARNVIGADRMRTAMQLVGDKGSGDAGDEQTTRHSLSPRAEGYLQRLIREGRKLPPPPNPASHPSISTSGESSDSGSRETSAAPTTASVSSSSANTPVRTESPALSSSDASLHHHHRAALSRRSTAPSQHRSSQSVNPYFKMTEEEARRVLWGEPSPPLSPLLSAPEVRAFAAVRHVIEEEEEEKKEEVKFGVSGGLLVEDKMLVLGGNKQPREDMDRRIGLG